MKDEALKQLTKIGKGAIIAGLGAGVIALLQFVQGADFGMYTPAVVAIASILINAARVYFVEPEH